MILYKSPAGAASPLSPLSPFAVCPLVPSCGLSPCSALSSVSLESARGSSLSVFLRAIRRSPPVVRIPLRRSREARDRLSNTPVARGDPSVLSRRFQLIFIVYLPGQRYLRDNGPPRYIRAPVNLGANAEVYLLSLFQRGPDPPLTVVTRA